MPAVMLLAPHMLARPHVADVTLTCGMAPYRQNASIAWLLSPRAFESLYQPPERMAAPLTARDGVATFTYNPQTDDGKYLYQAADGTMQPFYNKSGAELRAEFAARKAKEAAAR